MGRAIDGWLESGRGDFQDIDLRGAADLARTCCEHGADCVHCVVLQIVYYMYVYVCALRRAADCELCGLGRAQRAILGGAYSFVPTP